MKIQIVSAYSEYDLVSSIRKVFANKDIIDIKYSTVYLGDKTIKYSAMVLYKDEFV